jgi:hypothetical protein
VAPGGEESVMASFTISLRGAELSNVLRVEAFELMKARGSSIAGSDEVENGIHHPEITDCQTVNVFVPLGPWEIGN